MEAGLTRVPDAAKRGFGPGEFGWADAKVLVVVAHPDDEVLGCGATLAAVRDAAIVHVTDGAPQGGEDAARHGFASPADYARARRSEAEAALALAGIEPNRVETLGISDQETSLHLAEVARALAPKLDAHEVVLTHAFEGGHSDHDAVAFAVHAARRLCRTPPAIVEMPFYFAGADDWVRQCFLPNGAAGPTVVRNLTGEEQQLKARMLAAHASQGETLRSFGLDREQFRPAPPYDFLRRPHDGPLLYERHGWNLTWPDWCARVAAAERALGFDAGRCA